MRHTRNHLCCIVGLPAVIMFVVSASSVPALAEEQGTWRGRAVLITTTDKAVEVADQQDHSVSLSEYDGLVFNDEGKPFLDKARYQVVGLVDTGGLIDGTVAGYKTFTADDGSQVFAKYRGTDAAPPVFKGEWEFIGGTGKYQGITGQGTYTFHAVADTVAWDVLEGEYTIPGEAVAAENPPQ